LLLYDYNNKLFICYDKVYSFTFIFQLNYNPSQGDWPLIIWEATTAKRNYYTTN